MVWAVSLIGPIPDRRSESGVAFGGDIGVRCPDAPPRLGVDQARALNVAVEHLRISGTDDTESLERTLAHKLRDTLAARGATSIPFFVFDDRPAVEPALRVVWPSFTGSGSRLAMQALLSDLLAEPAVERQGPCATVRARDGTRSVFPPATEAAGWLERIEAAERSNPDPFAMACFAYAQTVLSHPYQDGNGRLARAMYQRSLGRSGLLSGPLLPLGPLVYANARVHDRALQHLGAAGDWGPFVEVMRGLTRKAAAFTRHTLAQIDQT